MPNILFLTQNRTGKIVFPEKIAIKVIIASWHIVIH